MKLFSIGIILTILYFVSLGIVIHELSLKSFNSWNEFGDFLSGAFSPIAFLWLVLGYIQQQNELQQNTEALRLQAEELKNSVKQYEAMVNVAREQLLSDREMMLTAKREKETQFKPRVKAPVIRPSMIFGNSKVSYHFTLEVAGVNAINLSIKTTPQFRPLDGFSNHLLKEGTSSIGETREINIDELPNELTIIIQYESILGIPYVDEYIYSNSGGGVFSIVSDTHK